jgi:hypothetical protein
MCRYSNWLWAGRLRGWSLSTARGKIVLLCTLFTLVLGPTQPPIQWVPWALFPGVMQPGVKLTTHFHLVLWSRMRGSIHSLPHTSSWGSAYLIKHRDNFTLPFTLLNDDASNLDNIASNSRMTVNSELERIWKESVID